MIGQAFLRDQDSAVLNEQPLSVKVQLPRDLQSNVRRDLQEQKETCFSQHFKKLLLLSIDFEKLSQLHGEQQIIKSELHFSFNVLNDDGNLSSSISTLAVDLLS